jgi:hypothetical protein
MSFPHQPQVIISPWVVHNVYVSAAGRNRDLSAYLQRRATRSGFGLMQRRCYAAPNIFTVSHFPPLLSPTRLSIRTIFREIKQPHYTIMICGLCECLYEE